MNARDCLWLLFGSRAAILRAARCRQALWLALLFVFVAGLAREYDQEDLSRRPWMLLVAPAASLVVASVMFLVVFRFGARPGQQMRGADWRRFTTLFWLTGPLAWIYAVPYERMLEGPDAIMANLWSLGLVATWRVLLMVRMVSVVHGTSARLACLPVLLVADAVALLALFLLPFPIIVVMGGTGGEDAAARGVACCMLQVTLPMLPVLFVVTGVAALRLRRAGGWSQPAPFDAEVRVRPSAWWLAVAATVLLVAITVPTQLRLQRERAALLSQGMLPEGREVSASELRRLTQVNDLFNRIEAALDAGQPVLRTNDGDAFAAWTETWTETWYGGRGGGVAGHAVVRRAMRILRRSPELMAQSWSFVEHLRRIRDELPPDLAAEFGPLPR